jgi:hypothetical protein
MNLRVLRSAEGSLTVEISSPELQSVHKWFVPLLPEDSGELKGLDPAGLVSVMYQDKTHRVPFFLILTVPVEDPRELVVGALSQEDSINVLNNIYDRLAYDRS